MNHFERVVDVLESEPVRVRLYPVLILIVGYLATQGIISGDIADLSSSLAGLILGIGATEAARAKVTPAATEVPVVESESSSRHDDDNQRP